MATDHVIAHDGSQVNHSNKGTFSQLAAAFALGGFFAAAMLALIVAPLAIWLAWKYPYLVIPPGITYILLSFDGAEHKDGRPWPAFMKTFWVFRCARDYYDLQIHLDPALEPSNMTGDEQFIFGLHPHGVLTEYRVLLDSMMFDSFPNLRSWRTLAASILFKFPLWREVSLWSHCIDAARKTAQYAIEKGHSLFIVPGGEREQILGQFGHEILYLKSRMGFVKLALRNGIPLVPVYVFGANDSFYTSTFLRGFRLALTRRFRIAIPIFWGRCGSVIPRQVPLRIVFGAPLKLGKYAKEAADSGAQAPRDVTDEEVKEAHSAYVLALKHLFDHNKAKFGYTDRELCLF